jgi:hypothetical protein
MLFDLPGGRRLVLAGGQLGWFWIAAGALAAVLLVVLYQQERRLVSQRAGLFLLVVRLLAAVVLVAALFEPIAARTYREVLRGRVLVAVDVSASMSTADPGRTVEERTALGKTLGLSPAEPIAALSRREVSRLLLAGESAPLARLAADHAVEAFTFARGTTPATLGTLASSLKVPPERDDPAVGSTDWEPVLAEALKGSDSKAPVLGVVLVTDGRRNASSDAGPTIDRLAARGVPVFPVLVGSTKPPRDAAVASVKVPELVYKGDMATVEATLKLDGYAGREVAITLHCPGASPLRQTAQATAAIPRPTVTFRVPLEDAGIVPMTVTLEALEGDSRSDNNYRTETIQVVDDKARVLLVDGEARWEFRYLRNALARDPRVNVETVVFEQPRAGLSSETAYTYGTSLPAPEGTAPDPLGTFDAIVLGDVAPANAPGETWRRLDWFVAERGGTLVFSPGPRFWAVLGAGETTRKLLPVLDPKPIDVDPRDDDPVHPGLPPGVLLSPSDAAVSGAGSWPMLQLASEANESRRCWASLPRLPWAIAGNTKPGATTLATAADDPSAVVLAAQPYGLGKVLWVGTDGTWRWRHRVGDAYHHRFWGQVVRWAATGKLVAGNALVRFGPSKPRTSEGEAVRLQARISEGVVVVRPDMLIAARIFKSGPGQDKAIAVVPLRPAPGQSRTFEGVAPSLPVGAYVMRLDVPGMVETLQLEPRPPTPVPQAGLEIVARDTSERIELAAARYPLECLAAATGGQVVADFEAQILPSLLRARTKETVRTEETLLWDSPPALLLFLAIVTVEWVARKRVGLP